MESKMLNIGSESFSFQMKFQIYLFFKNLYRTEFTRRVEKYIPIVSAMVIMANYWLNQRNTPKTFNTFLK